MRGNDPCTRCKRMHPLAGCAHRSVAIITREGGGAARGLYTCPWRKVQLGKRKPKKPVHRPQGGGNGGYEEGEKQCCARVPRYIQKTRRERERIPAVGDDEKRTVPPCTAPSLHPPRPSPTMDEANGCTNESEFKGDHSSRLPFVNGGVRINCKSSGSLSSPTRSCSILLFSCGAFSGPRPRDDIVGAPGSRDRDGKDDGAPVDGGCPTVAEIELLWGTGVSGFEGFSVGRI